MPPSRITCSNLNARFYVKDGWTYQILRSFLIKGNLDKVVDKPEGDYYILNVGGRLDIKQLLDTYPDVEVISCFMEDKRKTKEQLLEERNW